MNDLQFTFKRVLEVTEEKMTRLKFVSLSILALFVYIILSTVGGVLNKVLVLGIGDLCTLLGFSIIVLFSVKADLRLKLVKYIKKEILDNERP